MAACRGVRIVDRLPGMVRMLSMMFISMLAYVVLESTVTFVLGERWGLLGVGMGGCGGRVYALVVTHG